MDLHERAQIRSRTEQRRCRPSETVARYVDFGGGGRFGDVSSPVTLDLTVEATNEAGELAEWLDDDWWMGVLHRVSDSRVTIHVAPCRGALLHPVMTYQLEMLRRVAPTWRLVGYAFRGDVRGSSHAALLARSPYDEVRFHDTPRSSASRLDEFELPVPLAKLFGEVRSIQSKLRSARPVLVRLPADSFQESASWKARQGGVASQSPNR